MAGEIFAVSTSSLDMVTVNNTLIAQPLSTFDLSAATYVSGTFQGIGSALTGVTASYINITVTSSISSTASYIAGANVVGTVSNATNAIFSTQATNATNSLSTSYISASNLPPHTASWSNNALTASYITASNINGVVLSSSYTLTASYSLNGGSSGTSLTTASTYPITASWAGTASWALNSNVFAGLTSTPTFTDFTSSQTVIIGSASVNLYNNPLGIGSATSYNLLPVTFSVPTSTSASFVYAYVNGTTASYGITTNMSDIDGISKVYAFTLYRQDIDAHWIQTGPEGLALANKLESRLIDTSRFAWKSGFTLVDTGSNQFIITAGSVWYGATQISQNEFDSRHTQSATLTVGYDETHWVYHSASQWYVPTASSFQTLGKYNSGFYDDGANLQPLTTGYYCLNYFYRILGDNTYDDDVFIVIGQAQYADIASAQNDSAPSNVPSVLSDVGLLVGRMIVQSGSISASRVESAFTTQFGSSGATVLQHNSLIGIQGGIGGEYYHMSLADYTGTGTGIMVRQASPVITGLNATGSLQGTSSWALNSISSSYYNQLWLNTSSLYPITTSWSNNSLTSSYVAGTSVAGKVTSSATADTASYILASNVNGTIANSTFAIQSTYSTQSVNATASIYATSASWISASVKITTADTASYISASNLPPHTSSWANNSLTASYIVGTGVIGKVTSSTTADTASYILASNINGTVVNATFAIQSTYSTQSIYATQSVNATSASWASSSISALSHSVTTINSNTTAYLNFMLNTASYQATYVTTSITTNPFVGSITAVSFTGSHFGTSSIANTASFAITASYALNAGSTGTSLTTGSTYPITSSWAISASWAPSGTSGTTLTTGSTYPITASWATNAVNLIGSVTSASYAATASLLLGSIQSASFATTADSINISSSVANFGYSVVLVVNSGSNKQLLIDGSDLLTYNPATETMGYVNTIGTSSWASSSISSSYALSASWAPGGATITGTDFNVPVILSNQLQSSSLWANANQVAIGSASFDVNDPEALLVWASGSGVSTTTIAAFYHATNNFGEIKVKNTLTGVSASSDMVTEADTGTSTYGYINVGINNSGYGEPAFSIIGALDGYLYSVGSGSIGGDLAIGTLNANKAIFFHTSGSTPTDERMRITDNSITSSVVLKAPLFLGTSSWATSSISANTKLIQTTGSNATAYLMFALATGSYQPTYVTNSILVNPSIGTITATSLTASSITGTRITASFISASVIFVQDPVITGSSAKQQVPSKNYVDNVAPFGLDFYFRAYTSSVVPTYRAAQELQTPFSTSTALAVAALTANQYIVSYISDPLGINNINQGLINVRYQIYISGNGTSGVCSAHPELFIYSASVEKPLFVSGSPVPYFNVAPGDTNTSFLLTSSYAVNPTDRIVLKLKADDVTGTPDVTITHDGKTGTGMTIPIDASSVVFKLQDTASFATNALTASYVTGSKFSRGGTLYNSAGITSGVNLIVWKAPVACTVTNVSGYIVGGTNATINARKNGTLNHLASSLVVSSTDTWTDGGAVQNATYAAGDKLEIMVVSATGNPTQVAIQVDFTK